MRVFQRPGWLVAQEAGRDRAALRPASYFAKPPRLYCKGMPLTPDKSECRAGTLPISRPMSSGVTCPDLA
jgi:hypothetical protein